MEKNQYHNSQFIPIQPSGPWVSTDLSIFPQNVVDEANRDVAMMRDDFRQLTLSAGKKVIDSIGITMEVPVTSQAIDID